MKTQQIKSNPYVYPYTPFKDLSQREKKAKFNKDKTITTNELKKVVDDILPPKIKINGSTTAEKILSIFLNKEIRFGSEEYIEKNREHWLNAFNYFINKSLPLQMTILGFPFKMPVSLKTNRTFPDMGEVLSLKRLYNISQLIKSVYKKGAVITIITEGVFGEFNNLPLSEGRAYMNFLKFIISKFELDHTLKIIALDEIEQFVSNFHESFDKKKKYLQKLYEDKDSAFLKKYTGAKESITRIISTKHLALSEETLMNIYNDFVPYEQLSKEAKNTRDYLQKMAHEMLIKYYAYLMLRDELHFLEKVIPHNITLSVSPKENRLGIKPVDSNCIRLPYHGVPVYNMKENNFTIEYLIDLERTPGVYQRVYWEEDQEQKQFYYIKEK